MAKSLEPLTEQQHTERRSRLATALENLIDVMDIALWELDDNYRVVAFNGRARDIYGEDIIGQFCYYAAAKRDTICPNCPVQKVYAGAPSGRSEHERVDTHGHKIYIDHLATPIKDKEGNLTGALVLIIDITDRKRAEQEHLRVQQELLETQRRVIEELSTPIIPLTDEIIVAPLVGMLDTKRAKDIMRALLAGINAHRARVVILDITGVPVIDSGIAAHLDKTIQAARLKGARVIVTGISDAVAEALVDLGIDWRGIETRRDLQTGLRAATRLLNWAVPNSPRKPGKVAK